MPERSLILIGGGGHCRSCIDVIESSAGWSIKGILEQKESDIGTTVLGYPVIGTNDHIEGLIQSGHHFLITVGQISSAGIRKELYGILKAKGAKIATVISGLAKVSRHAVIGEGTIIHHMAIVNAAVSIGGNNIINTGANIEHDVRIGSHNHISTCAVLNGNVTIGNECFIGSGSIVANGITITDKVVLGAGGLVIKNIEAAGTYVGAPGKKLNR